MPAVKLTVNGKAVSGEVEDRTLLVQFLRDHLGLTGTHVGCDTSQCGACVVHIDGRAVKSCTVLVGQANGANVTTIEGIAKGLGRRVVRLLSRDDLDTAFRHLELYDRFGCPAGHVQAAFRCVIKQGEIDPKATEKLDTRVLACWVNPNGEAVGTAAAPSASSSR